MASLASWTKSCGSGCSLGNDNNDIAQNVKDQSDGSKDKKWRKEENGLMSQLISSLYFSYKYFSYIMNPRTKS